MSYIIYSMYTQYIIQYNEKENNATFTETIRTIQEQLLNPRG